MKQQIVILRSAIIAGICISIGCVVNLRVGGVAGAVLFAFGLLAVVYYKLKLYTGTAGFIRSHGDWSMYLCPARYPASRPCYRPVKTGKRSVCLLPACHRMRIYYDHCRSIWARRKISSPTLRRSRLHPVWFCPLRC